MMTTHYASPPPFNPGENNPAAEWTDYRESFKIYARAAKLSTEDAETQIAIFLHVLGPAGRRIYNTFEIPAPPELTLDRVLLAFDEYYEPYKDIVAYQYQFFTTFQGSHQTFAEFLTDLRTKARNCDFGALTSTRLCTQIVCGLRKEALRKDLLAKRNRTLEWAISRCQADEASQRHATTIAASSDRPASDEARVDAIRNPSRRQQTYNASLAAPTSRDRTQQRERRPQTQRPSRPNIYNPSTQPLRQRQTTRPHGSTDRQRCSNCNTTHNRQEHCPAYNADCYKCHRRGHWAACCRSQATHELDVSSYATDDARRPQTIAWEDDEAYTQYSLYTSAITLCCDNTKATPANTEEWLETIYLANFPITIKLDTGSQVNIIHEDIYNKFPVKPQLFQPPYTVRAYSGHAIDMLGVIYVKCGSFYTSSEECFYITQQKSIPILGATASVALGFISRHTAPIQQVRAITTVGARNWSPRVTSEEQAAVPKKATIPPTVHKDTQRYIPDPMPSLEDIDRMTPQDIIKIYRDVFDKIGKLPGKYTLRLKPDATPIISAPRQIPHALQSGVRKELDRLVTLGIITPVSEPTEWVHPMVIVQKPHTTPNTTKDISERSTEKESEPRIRICLDTRNLNKAVKREPYPTPTAQEIFTKLHGAEIFTVFDAQSAFWQVELDTASSLLCTFATPFGRFRFLRLALGICTSSSVFQRIMHEIYPPALFPNTHISTDDFLIATPHRTHNREIITVLERARQNGLTFSSEKMQLASRKITYLGLTVTPNGLAIDPARINAIQAIPSPAEKTALQRFLGMVNFVARFLPQHSTEAAPLRALLKKDITFAWDANAERTFNKLKQIITEAPVLVFFNPNRPITITVDSSSIGVGAALLQEQRPIEYASTSFTPTQQRYAPIERELLGVVYACERFQYYVTGTAFTVETDHRPLVSLIQKPIHQLSPRIQRLVLKLSRYNLKMIYVPGSQLYIADTLSRAPRKEHEIDTSDLEGPYVVIHATTSLPPEKLSRFQKETAQDPASQTLKLYIREGWPATMNKLHAPLKRLWGFQDEFHEMDQLIYRGDRLYVPDTLRRETMKQIHAAHQGINACLARARQHVYWPDMTTDVTEYVKQCMECQQRERANTPLPLLPHKIPQRPWEIVGSDMFHVGNKTYILLVDYFSKFVEAAELLTTNTGAVTKFMNGHFARHGAPQTLVSDNGPPYNSSAFHQFLQEWGVRHVTSSPYHPKSNGMAERTVQTIKNLMVKGQREGRDIQAILMEYRTTPIGNLPSPAEMLMGRQIRTQRTTSTESLRPHFPTQHITKTLQERQERMRNNNRPANIPEPLMLKKGTAVHHYIGPRHWGKGVIMNKRKEPHSYEVQDENGSIIRRTRHQLRPINQHETPVQARDTKNTRGVGSPMKLTGNTRQLLPTAITYRYKENPIDMGRRDQGARRQEQPHPSAPIPGPLPRRIPPSPIPDTIPPFPARSQNRPRRNTKPPLRYAEEYQWHEHGKQQAIGKRKML